jgi:pre-mRNA-splicing factor ATP-dependent RNA helicase DHX16
MSEDASLLGNAGRVLILPLHSQVPSSEQRRCFRPAPGGATKVILATNIAETSLTVPGIVYVVDCGLVKQASYNPRTGVESLHEVEISQASARQRLGRAGRTGPGKCFRLYTQWAFDNSLPPDTPPEILRVNLASVVRFNNLDRIKVFSSKSSKLGS